jgi:hypothetical protein
MDGSKIEREHKYRLDKIHGALDDLFLNQLHLLKGDDGFYIGTGGSKDYANFCSAYGKLRDTDWFVDNVATWLFYISEDEAPEDYSVEDMKEFCQNRRKAS